jgi:hypothetical protein
VSTDRDIDFLIEVLTSARYLLDRNRRIDSHRSSRRDCCPPCQHYGQHRRRECRRILDQSASSDRIARPAA